MQTLFVVDLLNEMPGVVPGIIDIIMLFRANLFHFQCIVRAFNTGIVMESSISAYIDIDTMFFQLIE